MNNKNAITILEVLETEVAYYKTLLEPHATGHIHTTIYFLEKRIKDIQLNLGIC
jgi:hypothetical protein